MIDPTTAKAKGTVILNIFAGLVLAAILATVSWLLGPLKWPIQSHRIRRLILRDSGFCFVFNPDAGKSKVVTFLENGQVGEGQNNNEHSWRIKRGKLDILAVDGEIYSRFKYDPSTGKLVHTNDHDTRSLHGQFFVPQWEKTNYGKPNN